MTRYLSLFWQNSLCGLLAFALMACSQNISHNQSADKDAVESGKQKNIRLTHEQTADNAIATAKKNNDFRLLSTSGRRPTFPGIEQKQYAWVNEYCGAKFMLKTGDVINSEQHRQQRQRQLDYMQVFNKKMLIVCQRNMR